MIEPFLGLCPPNNSTFICTQVWKTVNPGVFDLHYWLYALAVMFSITALLVGYSVKHGVVIGDPTFIYLTWIGLFVGSLIDVLLNIIGWGFSALILFGMIIYILRGRF